MSHGQQCFNFESGGVFIELRQFHLLVLFLLGSRIAHLARILATLLPIQSRNVRVAHGCTEHVFARTLVLEGKDFTGWLVLGRV